MQLTTYPSTNSFSNYPLTQLYTIPVKDRFVSALNLCPIPTIITFSFALSHKWTKAYGDSLFLLLLNKFGWSPKPNEEKQTEEKFILCFIKMIQLEVSLTGKFKWPRFIYAFSRIQPPSPLQALKAYHWLKYKDFTPIWDQLVNHSFSHSSNPCPSQQLHLLDTIPLIKRKETQFKNWCLRNQDIVETMDSFVIGTRGFQVLPSFIWKLSRLTKLHLSVSTLNEFPIELSGLTSLTSLNFSKTSFSSIPAEAIRTLTNLTSLELFDNRLESLPREISELDELKYLNLENNCFKSLKIRFRSLKSLRNLNLAQNQFKRLPSNLTSLQSLEILNVEYNQLTELPLTLRRLSNLKMLNLRSNSIKAIPYAITTGLPECRISGAAEQF